MKRQRNTIAIYRTEPGAMRYARELAAKHHRNFTVAPHPRDFGFAIVTRDENGKPAYALKRPKGFGRS